MPVPYMFRWDQKIPHRRIGSASQCLYYKLQSITKTSQYIYKPRYTGRLAKVKHHIHVYDKWYNGVIGFQSFFMLFRICFKFLHYPHELAQLYFMLIITPDRWQSKTFLTIDEHGSKIDITVFSIAICRLQSKTLFPTIFYLRSSKV